MVDEDSGDPSGGCELIDLDLEPAHVAPKIDGHRVHAGEDIEEIEFQLRRGRQRLRKVGAQLTALAEPASVDPPFDPHRPARWRLWREVSLTHHRR